MLFAQCTCTHIEWIHGPAFAEQNCNLMFQLYMVTHCIVRGGTTKEKQVDLPSKIKTHADPVVVEQASETTAAHGGDAHSRTSSSQMQILLSSCC